MRKLLIPEDFKPQCKSVMVNFIEGMIRNSESRIDFINEKGSGQEFLVKVRTNREVQQVLTIFLKTVLNKGDHVDNDYIPFFMKIGMFPQIMYSKRGVLSIAFFLFREISKIGWYFLIPDFLNEIFETADEKTVRNFSMKTLERDVRELYGITFEETVEYFNIKLDNDELDGLFNPSAYFRFRGFISKAIMDEEKDRVIK